MLQCGIYQELHTSINIVIVVLRCYRRCMQTSNRFFVMRHIFFTEHVEDPNFTCVCGTFFQKYDKIPPKVDIFDFKNAGFRIMPAEQSISSQLNRNDNAATITIIARLEIRGRVNVHHDII